MANGTSGSTGRIWTYDTTDTSWTPVEKQIHETENRYHRPVNGPQTVIVTKKHTISQKWK